MNSDTLQVRRTCGPVQPVDIRIAEKLWLIYDFPGFQIQWINGEGRPDERHVRPLRWTVTDYASFSVGLAYRFFKPRDAVYDVAAGVHDVLVRKRKIYGVSLRFCHEVFYKLLQLYDCPTVPAWTMYQAVKKLNWIRPGDGRDSLNYTLPAGTLERYYAIRAAHDAGRPIYDFDGKHVRLPTEAERSSE